MSTALFGGCQPAQKWPNDRKGGEPGYQDIEHYRNGESLNAELLRKGYA